MRTCSLQAFTRQGRWIERVESLPKTSAKGKHTCKCAVTVGVIEAVRFGSNYSPAKDHMEPQNHVGFVFGKWSKPQVVLLRFHGTVCGLRIFVTVSSPPATPTISTDGQLPTTAVRIHGPCPNLHLFPAHFRLQGRRPSSLQFSLGLGLSVCKGRLNGLICNSS